MIALWKAICEASTLVMIRKYMTSLAHGADVALDGHEEHRRRVGLRGGDQLGRAEGLDERPDDQAVEQAHEGHRQVGGARDGALRAGAPRAGTARSTRSP